MSGAQSLWRLLAACLLLAAAPAHAGFDAPLKKLVTQEWRDADRRSTRITVTCSYYPTFMVKVIKSDEDPNFGRSAIESGNNAKCQDKSRTEYFGWGSFRGVVGGYIFFDSGGPDDHGGRGFVITNGYGRWLMSDWKIGDFQSIRLVPGGVVLRYRRVFQHSCSLYYGGATGCWGQIKAKTALTDASTPECRDAYEAKYQEYKKKWPQSAKYVKTLGAAVSYNVEARIQDGKTSLVPLRGPAECWPG